jgi:hypothetical protein
LLEPTLLLFQSVLERREFLVVFERLGKRLLQAKGSVLRAGRLRTRSVWEQ